MLFKHPSEVVRRVVDDHVHADAVIKTTVSTRGLRRLGDIRRECCRWCLAYSEMFTNLLIDEFCLFIYNGY